MLVAQVLEHGGVGGITGLGLLAVGKLQLFKQDGGQLLWRIDVEVIIAGEFMDLVGKLVKLVGDARSQFAQARQVDPDAGPLHAGQNADQRHLHRSEKLGQAESFQLPALIAGEMMRLQPPPGPGRGIVRVGSRLRHSKRISAAAAS